MVYSISRQISVIGNGIRNADIIMLIAAASGSSALSVSVTVSASIARSVSGTLTHSDTDTVCASIAHVS